MPNPIKQFIEESGTSVVAKFSREDDGLLDLSKYDGDILEKEVIYQQLALVEKIKEMIESKRRKICGEKYNSTQEDINYGYDEALDDILQDLTIKK